jgi:hypothetical protein
MLTRSSQFSIKREKITTKYDPIMISAFALSPDLEVEMSGDGHPNFEHHINTHSNACICMLVRFNLSGVKPKDR